MPPIHMPLRRDAANLSRMRSPATSRSNWAKESRTLRVSPSHRCSGIELLGDGHERHAVCLKQFNQLGEIGKRSGQAVDFVNNHDIDLARLNVGEQRLKGRAFEGAAGEAAIVMAGLDQSPSFVGLALDVGFCGLTLGIKRVEILFKAMLGGLARVDGAAENFTLVGCHLGPLAVRFSHRASRKSVARSMSFR